MKTILVTGGAGFVGSRTIEHADQLIPLVLFAAMGREPSVKIFGNDYPTLDGTCIRDYVHVSDLASAHVAALERAEIPSREFGSGTTSAVRCGRDRYLSSVAK